MPASEFCTVCLQQTLSLRNERILVYYHLAELVGGMPLIRHLRKPRPSNLPCCAIASTSIPMGAQHWLVRCSSWSEPGLLAET